MANQTSTQMARYQAIPVPIYSLLDRALASFLVERSNLYADERRQLQEILLRLSSQLSTGDSCIPVDSDARTLIERSGLTNSGVNGAEVRPLVVENGRLYLYRYWSYENRLAQQLKALIGKSGNIDESLLARYFAESNSTSSVECHSSASPSVHPVHNWQWEAAALALSSSFTIITGGPGTGKTTTVVKIVAMLLEQANSAGNLINIALAAPTGKAAMRLQQSIVGSRKQLPCDENIRQMIPSQVVTLHRLLGPRRLSPYFKHRADNPLPYDLVIVDEASMVDLAMMSKLIDALKPQSKLILLGDRNQLASVESGAVLADLIDALPENSAELKQSFRFDENIKAVAEGVNEQRAEILWQALNEKRYANVSLLSNHAIARVVEQSQSYWTLVNDNAPLVEIIATYGKFQCLATNRIGPLGVININEGVESLLADKGLIERDDINGWYRGRPIIVTRNIPELGLFNGDIGITLNDSEGILRVYFDAEEGGRDFIPSRIPHCETAYAMTVHKSQGSEFDEVLILFPEVMNPVLTKELIYTAITRAKKRVEISVTENIWLASVQQKIERHSGLVDKLKSKDSDDEN